MDIFSIISERMKGNSGIKTLLEIGAADGGDTQRIMDAAGCPFRYFAFEPDPRNIATLRLGKLMRNLDFNLIESAIGNINQTVKLNLSNGIPNESADHWWYSSSVKTPKRHLDAHPWCKFEGTANVQMMRLDDVRNLYGIGEVDFIWCDIQGAEDLMIAGAQNTLFNTRLFYSECYEQELYEGQIGRHEILKRLPGEWKIANEWESDVLFENLRFK